MRCCLYLIFYAQCMRLLQFSSHCNDSVWFLIRFNLLSDQNDHNASYNNWLIWFWTYKLHSSMRSLLCWTYKCVCLLRLFLKEKRKSKKVIEKSYNLSDDHGRHDRSEKGEQVFDVNFLCLWWRRVCTKWQSEFFCFRIDWNEMNE